MTLSPPERFKSNVIDLVDFCKGLILRLKKEKYNVTEPQILEIGILVLNTYDDTNLIEDFINGSHIYWDQIYNKNEEFFIQHSKSIFKDLPAQSVQMFIDIFNLKTPYNTPAIKQDDRDVIWEFFETFVCISLNYIHEKRGPKLTEKEGQMVKTYTREYLSTIKLQKLSKQWKLELKW